MGQFWDNSAGTNRNIQEPGNDEKPEHRDENFRMANLLSTSERLHPIQTQMFGFPHASTVPCLRVLEYSALSKGPIPDSETLCQSQRQGEGFEFRTLQSYPLTHLPTLPPFPLLATYE